MPGEIDPYVDEDIHLGEIADALSKNWRQLAAATFISAALGGAIAFLITPKFTARALLLPPQQQSSSLSAALGSLGALAGLAGSNQSPADQYVSFMTSVTVEDQIIKRFDLMKVYENDLLSDTRLELEKLTNISVGKKDGLITIEVDDVDPKRAAEIANAYIDGLRYMTNTLAISEAQQRRAFFEQKLKEAKDNLAKAQIALQAIGYNPEALKAEPLSAAETYARFRAEVTAGEAKLQSLTRTLTDSAPEVIQQRAVLATLRSELTRLEHTENPASSASADYITRLREFKYQEDLFELFAKQFELARVDEAREGALVQVVDAASPPDKKSKPKRLFIILGFSLLGLALASIRTIVRRNKGINEAY